MSARTAVVSLLIPAVLAGCRSADPDPRPPDATRSRRAGGSAAEADPSVALPPRTRTELPASPGRERPVAGPSSIPERSDVPGRPAPPTPAPGAGEPANGDPPPEVASGTPRPEETPAVPSGAALSARCREHLETLESLRRGIPLIFVGAARSLDDIDRDIRRAIELAEAFLESCNDDSPEAAWVKVFLGRDYLSLYRRHAEAFQKAAFEEVTGGGVTGEDARLEVRERTRDEMASYRAKITRLAQEALDGAAPGSETRYQALALLADAAAHEGDFEAQVRTTREILASFPGARDRPKFLSDIGQGLLHQQRYGEAADWLRKAAEKHRADEQYVVYNNDLFDALTGIGDLEGMERLMHRVREEYPERIESARNAHYRSLYEQWYDLSSFWIGFVRYALGDIERAKRYLREGMRRLEVKRYELEKEGKALPSVQQVFLNFRFGAVLRFVEELHGTYPRVADYCRDALGAADLSEGIRWATDRELTLRDTVGKVTAVLFRLPGHLRSESLLLELDELKRRTPDLEAVMLGFFPTGVSESQAAQRLERMRSYVERHELGMPAGFDASTSQCVFRSLHATVGSPTLIVFDRQGRIAWYLQDPRDLDRKILVRVIERLVSES